METKNSNLETREKIEQYKIWFQNLSFFNGSAFILDEIENLWNLTNYIGEKYQKLGNGNGFSNYTKLNQNESIALAQQFFDNHQIPINIEKLIKSGTIILENGEKNKEDFFDFINDGSSYYDSDGSKKIKMTMEGTILDSVIIIHEIMHYRNQPNGKRNFNSDFLTESLSYAAELIFFEDLKGTVFEPDRNLHFKIFKEFMYQLAYNIYYIYQIILVYKKENDINKEAYHKLFEQDDYEQALKEFEKYTNEKKSIVKSTWYVFGLPLAIYMFTEYQKNKNFWSSLEEFNKAMNKDSIDNCLRKIKINSREEFINKIKSSTEHFISLLQELYEKG